MFGLGMSEVIVILALGLLLFGAKRLPDLARSLGRTVTEFRREASELTDELRGPGGRAA